MFNPFDSSYRNEDSLKLPMPADMLKAAQNQHRNNQDALIARLRELLCPHLGDPTLWNNLVAVCFERMQTITDDDLLDLLGLDEPEIMAIWEARPISLFSCVHPTCRASIEVRNRAHLQRLVRLDLYFGNRVSAEDPVKAEALYSMLCESCAQELQDSHNELVRTYHLRHRARASQLSRMTWPKYKNTPEGRSLCSRVILRAGNRCEMCNKGGVPLQIHHRSYDRYGQERIDDCRALCRDCHARHHDVPPNTDTGAA